MSQILQALVIIFLVALIIFFIIGRRCCRRDPNDHDDRDDNYEQIDINAIKLEQPAEPAKIESITSDPNYEKDMAKLFLQKNEYVDDLLNVQSITRDQVGQMPVNLDNLINAYLSMSLNTSYKDRDLVVAVGMTGCGKSTVLQALIYGSDSLHQTTIGKKKVIESKSNKRAFKIGHEAAQSETFAPSFFHEDPDLGDLTFVDLSGLFDTQGGLVELLNTFISTKILSEAKSVRFLLPIQYNSLLNQRGQIVREQLDVIHKICKGQDNDKISKSIIPIITKFPLAQQDNVDIDIIRDDLLKILEEYVNVQKDDTENGLSDEKLDELQKFYEIIVFNFNIVDPLNRVDKIDSLKIADLLEMIKQAEGIPGSELNTLMSSTAEHNLEKMLEQSQTKCKELGYKYVEQIKENGPNAQNIKQIDSEIRYYIKSILFLWNNSIYMPRVKEFYDSLVEWIEETINKIEVETRSKVLKDEQKIITDLIEKLDQIKEQNNPQSHITTILSILNQITHSKSIERHNLEETSAFQLIFSNGNRAIEDFVIKVGKEPDDLMAFSYELRKQDTDGLHSRYLLEGQVKPQGLSDLLLSNEWNSTDNQMKAMSSFMLTFNLSKSTLCIDMAQPETPVIVPVSKESILEFRFILQSNGLLICAYDDSQIKKDNIKKWKYLAVDSQTKKVKWIDENVILSGQQNDMFYRWFVVPVDLKSDFNYFFIELAHESNGQRPRLISKKSDPGTKSELMIATPTTTGYNIENRNTWTLNKK